MLKKNRWIALVLALVLTLALAACGGPEKETTSESTPEALAAKYAEALELMKPSAMFSLASEQEKQAIAEESGEEVDLDAELKVLDDMAAESMKEIKEEYGNYEITCTVTGTTEIDQEEKDYIIEDFKDYYEVTVEDVVVYAIDVTIVTGEEVEEDTADCYLVKIDGQWYLDLGDSDVF